MLENFHFHPRDLTVEKKLTLAMKLYSGLYFNKLLLLKYSPRKK